mmetsp:Transcript_24112/g.42791  ORF Transcript_24112/g.42791 Transcript_24112/m.42791 type:complete len:100 (+) Transcript_24112:1620-1919(+)
MTKFRLTPTEELVSVTTGVWSKGNPPELPHVQLSLKALEFGLGEILGHNLSLEDSFIMDLESISSRNPRYHVLVTKLFSVLEDLSEFPRERHGGNVAHG